MFSVFPSQRLKNDFYMILRDEKTAPAFAFLFAAKRLVLSGFRCARREMTPLIIWSKLNSAAHLVYH